MALNLNTGAVVPGGLTGGYTGVLSTVSGVTGTSSAGGAVTIATVTSGTQYITMFSSVSGTASLLNVSSSLTYDPATGTLNATASSAKYADLAEKYVADNSYDPGTVVIFGGDAEITTTNISHDTRVAGVISTNPAYLMNDVIDGLPVALTGRVPCLVKGPVNKGTILVTSSISGVAEAIDESMYRPGSILGKSLSSINNDSIELIEIVVGRF